MKDGSDYAEMLEMPVSSCDVVIRPARRKRAKNVKEELIAKVNGFPAASGGAKGAVKGEDKATKDKGLFSLAKKTGAKRKKAAAYADGNAANEAKAEENAGSPEPKRKKFAFDVVYAEGVAIFALIAAILLTNVFWEDSGMNRLFRNVFSTATVSRDNRDYKSFSATSPSNELEASVSGGVMTLSGKGAVYPVCDGKVTAVSKVGEKYDVTVSHSDVFKTVISGADYVYAEVGDEAYKYVPVAYLGGGSMTLTMYGEDGIVTGYVLENGSIVWEA